MANDELDNVELRRLLSFQMTYNKRSMKTTWVLAFVIIGIYLLEEYFGGSQNVSVLMRMGANVGPKVFAGEYYRLFSSVFLHAGFLHVFFNTYVLFALGGFFNRVLGESRYLSVLLLSGLCGSLSSIFLGRSTLSVGASGAIWGLIGASLALSVFKTSLLPEPIRLNLRRITLINLVINLGISFLPMIDMWAHIGGGIGGFVLGLLIVISSRDLAVYRKSTYFFRTLSAILAVAYILAITYGLWLYAPWQNQMKASFIEVKLSEVPFSLKLPSGLKQMSLPNNTKTSAHYIFGEPGLDGLVVELHFFNQEILGTKALDKQWLSLKREELLKENSLSAEVKKTIYFKDTLDGGVLYYQQMPKNSDLLLHNYLIIRGAYVIRLGLLLAKSVKQAEADALADKIMDGLNESR